MSAPGVSGTYGQLVQAYKELNGGVTPTSALVKGALLNTADDLGNAGPDFKFGWGRMNARKVVQVFQNNTYLLDSIAQGAANQHQITVPSNVSQVKIMVYWNDYEGSTVTTQALVNNLDMTVVDPSSATLLPYVLDPTPNAANLNSPATNGVDSINNMEQVVINTPAAGTYTVNVSGTAIPQGPQKYYVIYEFITDEIVVTYPIGGEGFTPGTAEVIRWDASNGTNTFMVEYSTDNGVSWNTLSTGVNANLRYYNWNVPSVVTGKALIKVTRNGVSSQSQMPFSIIGVPANITVTTSCPTSFDVTWNAVSGATAYEISVLGAKYMDSVMTVSTTNATLNGFVASNSYWVSVKALTADAVGKRAIAIYKPAGVWNCVLANDVSLSELESPSGNAFFDCITYANVPVAVKLKNIGTQTQSNFDLSYQFNGGTVVTETFTGTLNQGDSAVYSFTTGISFTAQGQYNLNIWKVVPDDNVFNDSINNPFELYSGTTVTLPYTQDFENFSSCATTTNCGIGVCNLSQGWMNQSNGNWDDIDFRVDNGGTPSNSTGPSVDHSPGNSGGNYLYLEASGGCDEQEAQIISPCIDITNMSGAMASVWYHAYGSNMGSLHFDVLSNGKWHLDVISPISGNKGDNWFKADIDLTPFVGNIVNVRFRGYTGMGYRADLAIDDFSVVRTGLMADFTVDAEPCINNGPVTFTDASSVSSSSYAWDFGVGANPLTATGVGPHQVSYSTTGTKVITLMVSDGTFSDTAIQNISVVDQPMAQFTSVFNEQTSAMSFTNTSTGLGTSLWDFGDGTNSTALNPVHIYPAKGYYNVALTVNNSCGSDTLLQRVDNFPLGINALSVSDAIITLFPNPTSSVFSLKAEAVKGETVNVVLFNTQGKIVWQETFEVVNSRVETEINVSHLSRGVYVVKFITKNNAEQLRLVVQ